MGQGLQTVTTKSIGSDLNSRQVRDLLLATSLEGRNFEQLEKVQKALARLVGLDTKYKLAFTRNPHGGLPWVIQKSEGTGGAEFVSGYIKLADAKPGEGQQICSFKIKLSDVNPKGEIGAIELRGLRVDKPAQKGDLMKNLVSMYENRWAPPFAGSPDYQKPIDFVGDLNGKVVAVREKYPQRYSAEKPERTVEVRFIEVGSYLSNTASIENFSIKPSTNPSAERRIQIFDGTKPIGYLTVNFDAVRPVTDNTVGEAVVASKKGRGALVDRSLGRKFSDGDIKSVEFTPIGGSPITVKDLRALGPN